jgi:G3E family GTPase
MQAETYFTWMQGTPVGKGLEGYPLYEGDPYRSMQEIINVYLTEIQHKNKTLFKSSINPEDYSTGRTLLNLPPQHHVNLLLAIFSRLYWLKSNHVSDAKHAYFTITSTLFRRKQPFTAEQLATILGIVAECYGEDTLSIKGLIRQAEWFTKDHGLVPAFEPYLRKIQAPYTAGKTAEDRKMSERIEDLISGKVHSQPETV